MPTLTTEPLAPKRFPVTFANISGTLSSYDVCTCLNRDKALAMAAAYHERKKPAVRDQIYTVVEVVQLAGEEPQSSDLVDRAEW